MFTDTNIMKKSLILACLIFIFSTGCTMHVNVPYVDVGLKQPESSVKTPVRVAVIIPDEKYIMTKTVPDVNGSGISIVYAVPFGQIIKKASSGILPNYFEKVKIVTAKPALGSTDLLFIPKINDFDIRSESVGFSSFNVEARVLLDVTIADSKGAQIWKKTIVSPWKSKTYSGFSQKKYETTYGTVVADATNSAFKDAVRGMFMSRVFKNYLAGKGGQQIIPSKKSQGKVFKLPPLRSDTYAIVIGIDYKNRKDIPHLQYASNDARQVYEVLTDPRYGGVPKENAILLLNERATRNQMMVALRKIRDRDGYVYVYYSGHGAPKTKGDQFIDAYLVPDNAIVSDPEALEDTSIKMSYLQKLMNASHAKGIMVALDACFSGGGKSIVPKGGKPLVGMLVTSGIIKPKGTGKVLITSSATNQQSWEDEAEIKGGIFTHYLLKGLMGKGGKDVWVKIDELSDYVKKNVPKASKRLKGQEQYPQITGKGNFVVTRNWDVVKIKDINIARSRLKTAFEHGNINARQLSRAMDELKSGQRSKTLEAYLEGKIGEENFGALY